MKCANCLHGALIAHEGESKDIDFLIGLPGLSKAISDAKNGLIEEPRDLGLGIGIWIQESNIRDYKDVSSLLSEFGLLLKGWELPGTPSWEH